MGCRRRAGGLIEDSRNAVTPPAVQPYDVKAETDLQRKAAVAELGPLKLQNIHLSQNWKIGVPGRILQLRGAGGSAGIPADDIYYGMHVTFPAPQAGPIHAILDLTGPNPGSMLSAPHWDSNALDITSEVEVVALEGLAPRAVMSPLGMNLGALYKHKKDAAYFT